MSGRTNEAGDAGAVDARVERLAAYSPLYRQHLRRFPEDASWLQDRGNAETPFRYSAFAAEWERLCAEPDAEERAETVAEERAETVAEERAEPDDPVERLRRFRRRMSLRIALREANGLADIRESGRELTLLAEFCIRTVLDGVRTKLEADLGEPWDDDADGPARFAVIGLGKLGAEELNFCSDVDLLFVFSGPGHCRSRQRRRPTTTAEFHTRLARELTTQLSRRTAHGFLYNVDLRLRPEGDSGPLVRSLSAFEGYYSQGGQTWERMALIRARPVAGNTELGEDLLEAIQAFRYPRLVAPAVVQEVAGLKLRTEREAVAEGDLERHIKSGPGGIREVEFITQVQQLLHGGSNPFLQTGSTFLALDRLERYELLTGAERRMLEEAYRLFRRVENLLQIREERQVHLLPPEGSEDWAALATAAGAESPQGLRDQLDRMRAAVAGAYRERFTLPDAEERIQEWTILLEDGRLTDATRRALRSWFGDDGEAGIASLRKFVLGDPRNHLMRSQILAFADLADHLDDWIGELVRPRRTLERIGRFSLAYGAARQFIESCARNPRFFRALALLFDRSSHFTELLTRHPEILEEIFAAGQRSGKDRAQIERELAALPAEPVDEAEASRRLWLYVQAEQVRLTIGALLGEFSGEELDRELTELSETVLGHILDRYDPEGDLAVIGLGKLGARELTLASDLDLILLHHDSAENAGALKKTQRLLRFCGQAHPLGRVLDIDLRLRPHGRDGPLALSWSAFRTYHDGGGAAFWERQALLRARIVRGDEQMRSDFVEWRREQLYGTPPAADDLAGIETMLERIAEEKGSTDLPGEAFKAGPGGLVDVAFTVQLRQLASPSPTVDSPNTLEAAHLLAEAGEVDAETESTLRDHYRLLRNVERTLRIDRYEAVSRLPEDDESRDWLAHLLEYVDGRDLLDSLQKRCSAVAEMTRNLRRPESSRG